MNIAISNYYTQKQILPLLLAEDRNVYYEFLLFPVNERGRKIIVEQARISYDSSQEVMRTFSGEALRSEIGSSELTDAKLIPFFCLKTNKEVVRWPLGKFLLNMESEMEAGKERIKISGYDMGKLAYDDKIDSRYYVASGEIYTSKIGELLGTVYAEVSVAASTKSKTANQEWNIGTRKNAIVNELLNGISYNPLHFDAYGVAIADEYIFPQNKPISMIYQDDNKSILMDGFSIKSNKFEVPNKFVRYTENVDTDYLISTYINEDVTSPYSTVKRGRTIVDSESVDDIATQADLDNYTKKIALMSMQSTEQIRFNTINMPGHEYKDCFLIRCKTYGIEGKYVESSWEMELSPGGRMRHVMERVMLI